MTLQRILQFFKLSGEQEPYDRISETIQKGVVFNGTNLWILVFAIFIASVGLNVNSTAVIIGAMLVSPLMGPIIGIGLGLGTNDIPLIRKAVKNLGFAVVVSLITSTVYFVISPLNEAHSELFARTSPNIYDVLIALFGGFAGIIATTSRQKGNVIQGVAIATALMPPLCTAGFGIAIWDTSFIFGALYLFTINSVFIALSTYVTVRLLNFPNVHYITEDNEKKIRNSIIGVVLVTVVPSIYLGYKLAKEERFVQKANNFIEQECNLKESFVLEKNIDPVAQKIVLVLGGEDLDSSAVREMNQKLKYYKLPDATVEFQNKLSFRKQFEAVSAEGRSKTALLSSALSEKQGQLLLLQSRLDSIADEMKLAHQVEKEIAIQLPQASKIIVSRMERDSSAGWLASIRLKKKVSKAEIQKLQQWLQTRLTSDSVDLLLDR